ncbi:hypothetical protein [Sporosarcina sp. ACRSL]|nr:hypothetical protein [Sporosarcina sp. ACRSL]
MSELFPLVIILSYYMSHYTVSTKDLSEYDCVNGKIIDMIEEKREGGCK